MRWSTARGICKAKPEPDVFLSAASELGIAPRDCVVFEDAEAGIEAAIRAGMGSVGVGKPEILKKADLVIANFEQLRIVGQPSFRGAEGPEESVPSGKKEVSDPSLRSG